VENQIFKSSEAYIACTKTTFEQDIHQWSWSRCWRCWWLPSDADTDVSWDVLCDSFAPLSLLMDSKIKKQIKAP
jgi:hypothetical protein